MQHEYIINGVTFTEEQLRKEAEENNVPYEEYLSSLTSITQKEKELTFNDLTYSQKQNYFRNFSQDTSQEDYLNQIKEGLNVEARDIENNFFKTIDLTSDEIEAVKAQVGADYFKTDGLDDRNATVRSTYITPSGSTRQSGALENKYKTDDYKKFIENNILPNSNKVKDDYEKYAQQLKLKKAEIQIRDIGPQVKPFINAFKSVGFENEEQAKTYLNDTYDWFEKELVRFDEIEANLNKEETSYMGSLQNIKNKIDKVKGDASVLPKVNRDVLNSYINEYNTIVNKINEAGLEDQINSLNESKKAFNFKVNDFKNKSKKISNASI